MPELPEVENVRRSLAQRIVGRRVTGVKLHRADVVTGDRSPAAMLTERRITQVTRHGKQLAILSDQEACLCVHLGMTGSLCYRPNTADDPSPDPASHIHVIWTLDGEDRFEFRDPRRFGGIWTFSSPHSLHKERWAALGEDALLVTPDRLAQTLAHSKRPIKAALLDQSLVAGLGNIYVDELLFACGIHPATPSRRLKVQTIDKLVQEMHRILNTSIQTGGSTLRDYVDAEGNAGSFQNHHQVYGRAGEPCRACGATLRSKVMLGRTTVWCPACQTQSPDRAKRVAQ